MSSLALHLAHMDDRRRTLAFDRALAETIRPGDRVADIGAGTGILSLIALRHGAARVWAVEEGPVAEMGRRLARENGVEDRMIVVRGPSQEVRLPERVDVVVSEMLGNAVFDEDILELMADARERFLRPGGRMVPRSLCLLAAPAMGRTSRKWPYGVRLGAIRALGIHSFTSLAGSRRVGPAKILWRGALGRPVSLPLDLRCRWHAERADGVLLWFRAKLSASVVLESLEGTHWMPAFFPSREPLRGRIDFSLRYDGEGRFTWRFNGLAPQGSLIGDDLALAQLSLECASVPRIPARRAAYLRALSLVDGRRTVAQIARRLGGMDFQEAVRLVKSLCLRENLIW